MMVISAIVTKRPKIDPKKFFLKSLPRLDLNLHTTAHSTDRLIHWATDFSLAELVNSKAYKQTVARNATFWNSSRNLDHGPKS